MAGRNKPMAVLKAKGTDRADRHGGHITDKFKKESNDIAPPVFMPNEAKEYFVFLVGELSDAGILFKTDIKVLESHVMAIYYRDLAVQEMGKTPVQKTAKGETQSKWWRIYKDSNEIANKTASLFGFTPSDKARIRFPESEGGDMESKFDELT